MNADSSFYYANEAYQISSQNHYLKELVKSFNTLGTSSYLIGNTEQAINYYTKSIESSKQLQDSSLLISACVDLAVIYADRGEPLKAFIYNNIAIQYYNDHHDFNKLGIVYLNQASLFEDVFNYKLSIEYNQKAITLLNKFNSPSESTILYLNIGELYTEMNKPEIGIKYLDTALFLNNKYKTEEIESELFSICAYAYYKLGNEIESEKYAKKALLANTRNKNISALTYMHYTLANLYFDKKTYSKAEENALKSFHLSDEQMMLTMKSKSAELLSDIYKATNQATKALYFSNLHDHLNDSLSLAEQSSNLIIEKYKYDLSVKELELKSLEHQNENEIEANTKLRATAIVLALLLAILIMMLLHLRNLTKENKKINLQLDARMKEMQAQEMLLLNMNKNKEKMLSLLSHDLRSPMISLNALFDLFESGMLDQQDISNAIAALKKRTRTTIEMLENILKWSVEYAQTSFTAPILIPSWNKIVHEAVEPVLAYLDEKKIDLVIDPVYDVKLVAEPEIFKLIVRNLVNNAAKFSKKSGKIEIRCAVLENKVITEIRDYGQGMSPEQIRGILSRKLNSTPGTEHETGTGIGLRLCMDFVELSGGNLHITSEPGKGSVFSFDVPLVD